MSMINKEVSDFKVSFGKKNIRQVLDMLRGI